MTTNNISFRSDPILDKVKEDSELRTELDDLRWYLNKNLNSHKVGEMQLHQFSDKSGAFLYFLVSDALDNKSIRNCVFAIQDVFLGKTWKALKDYFQKRQLQKYWLKLDRVVSCTDRIWFYIEIALAIGVVLILIASTIFS